jgi:hypothetical protein
VSTPDAFVLRLSSGVTLHLKEEMKVSAADLVDFKTTAADGAFAEVSQNPNDPTVLGLNNLSPRAWTATLVAGSERQVESGKNIKLTKPHYLS